MKTLGSGFTLIELMIVVAIIGILSAIAIPKMANLIKRAQEGATKGNLGSLRSAIKLYSAEHEGIYPIGPNGYSANSNVLNNALVPTHLVAMPFCRVPLHHKSFNTVDNYSKFDIADRDDASCDGDGLTLEIAPIAHGEQYLRNAGITTHQAPWQQNGSTLFTR